MAESAGQGVRRNHFTIRRDVGAPDFVDAGCDVDRSYQIADYVVRGNRLNRGADPAWTDHERKSFGQISKHFKRDAPGAEYHRGPKLHNRNFSRCERCADLLATGKML